MKITQVRNATLLIEYAGITFLIDPVLAEQGAYPGFPGTPHEELRNPLVPLPFSPQRLLEADAVIVTHTHPDHWDEAAARLLPKDNVFFVQHEADATVIRSAGFTDVRVWGEHTVFQGVEMNKTGGQHGSDAIFTHKDIAARLGQVSGVVLRHPDEKTVYVAGDTVWNAHVATCLEQYAPDVVVLNAGWAQGYLYGVILMGAEDVLRVHHAAPNATLVASHMEAVNHCVLRRSTLRNFAQVHGFAANLLVPEDGETVIL